MKLRIVIRINIDKAFKNKLNRKKKCKFITNANDSNDNYSQAENNQVQIFYFNAITDRAYIL